MALINPQIPTIGQPNSTEDQDVANALTTIVAAINAGLDTANLAAAAGITAAQLATAVQAAAGLNGASTRRGKCIIATEETRTNAAYGLLGTPDRVSSIVLPTDGLMFIGYSALMLNNTADTTSAAIFLGANQLRIRRPGLNTLGVQEAAGGASSSWTPVATGPGGLFASTGSATPDADATTGQVLGLFSADAVNAYPGFVTVFAAAGTYDVSVQFKSASGQTSVKGRKLWVWSMGFD